MKGRVVFLIRNKHTKEYYRAVIEIETKQEKKRDWEVLKKREMTTLTIHGDLYYSETGRGKPKGVSWGQINTTIKELGDEWIIPPKLKRLLEIWEEYHLNDLQAGTKRQTEALLKKDKKLIYATNYEKAVEYLKSIGLYEDRWYTYGREWLCKEIPEEILKELEEMIR